MKKSLKLTLTTASAVVIIAATSITVLSVYHRSPDYTLSLAERYLSEMNYEQAVIEFEKYLEIDPKNSEVWLMLADTYEKMGEESKVKETLENALEKADSKKAGERLEKIYSDETETTKPLVSADTAAVTSVISNEPQTALVTTVATSSYNSDAETASVTAEITTNSAVTSSTIETTANAAPIALEKMILEHIKNGNPLDKEKLKTITVLKIYGEDVVCVECGDKKGTIIDNISYDNNSFSINDETTSYSFGKLKDISFIENCTNLTELSVEFNSISDLSPLKKLKKLNSVSFNFNNIDSISPLKGLKNLTKIHISDNKITDITAVSELYELEILYISGNPVSDLSPLKNTPKLKIFCASGNQITDISVLESLKTPEYIELRQINAPDTQAEALKKKFPNCIIYCYFAESTSGAHVWSPSETEWPEAISIEEAFSSAESNYNNRSGTYLYDFVYLKDRPIYEGLRSNNMFFITCLTELNADKDIYNPQYESFNFLYDDPVTFECEVIRIIDENGRTEYYMDKNTVSIDKMLFPVFDNDNDSICLSLTDEYIEKLNNICLASGERASFTITATEYYAICVNSCEPSYSLSVSDITYNSTVKTYTPYEIEDMIRNHIKYGDPIDEKALKEVTALTILGEDVVAVRCRHIEGGSSAGIQGYHNNYRSFTSTDTKYDRGELTDISFVKYLTNAEAITIGMNEIKDISPLKKLDKLVLLDLSFNNIKDISPLKNLTNISILELAGNRISDISPLERLTGITALNLMMNNISDISALTGMSSLNSLFMSSNNISDISPLSKLSKLDEVLLDDNNITDISSLGNIKYLEKLFIGGNNISYEQIFEIKDSFVLCSIDNEHIMKELLLS